MLGLGEQVGGSRRSWPASCCGARGGLAALRPGAGAAAPAGVRELLPRESLTRVAAELERERKPIESLADRVDFSARDFVARLHLSRPRREQLDDAVGRQRRYRVLLLGGHPESLPARHDHPASPAHRRAARRPRAQPRSPARSSPAIEQQRSARADTSSRSSVRRRSPRRDRRRYHPRLRRPWQKRNPPHAVRIAAWRDPPRTRHSEAGRFPVPPVPVRVISRCRSASVISSARFAQLAADKGRRLHGPDGRWPESARPSVVGAGGQGRLAWVGLEQRLVLSKDRLRVVAEARPKAQSRVRRPAPTARHGMRPALPPGVRSDTEASISWPRRRSR